jgi:hypothetical protein
LTRQQALIGGGALVAGGGTAAGIVLATRGRGGGASYPRTTIAQLSNIQPNTPISFNYPLEGQPSVLLDLDQAVPEGVGPKQSVVAYSLHVGTVGGARLSRST